MTDFIATARSMRPASSAEECFYCHVALGQPHEADCVLIHRKAKVRAVIEYEIEVPASWDGAMIEFARNDGTWCANNLIGELEAVKAAGGCLCAATTFEAVELVGADFLKEG